MVISLDTLSFLVPAKKLEFIDNSYEVNIDIFLTDVNINVLEKNWIIPQQNIKRKIKSKIAPWVNPTF